ncbi:hypothetical protein PR202_gb27087 [Eleusine coracana subsp. coracana]|uniref:Uncharacterized protein n=1 Tax=Eleusine coracana subsp. coracana TaxID=191504 RepID=A0AAV5FTG1_ELECO|nr:hypothetical protein PR202_gb27087 [Eleusine coracana subsp. coracana]
MGRCTLATIDLTACKNRQGLFGSPRPSYAASLAADVLPLAADVRAPRPPASSAHAANLASEVQCRCIPIPIPPPPIRLSITFDCRACLSRCGHRLALEPRRPRAVAQFGRELTGRVASPSLVHRYCPG